MSAVRKLKNKLLKLAGSVMWDGPRIPVLIGKPDGTISGDRSGYVWVTTFDGQSIQVYNGTGTQNYWEISTIGYKEKGSKRLEILGPWDVYGPIAPSQSSSNPAQHQNDHTWPGSQTVWIRGEQFYPWLVVPTSTFPIVMVYGGVYRVGDVWKYISSQELDLTSDIPGTGAVYCMIEADEDGNLSTQVTATPKAAKELLAISDIPDPSKNCSPIAAVKMYVGQEQFFWNSTINDFVDLRWSRYASQQNLWVGDDSGDCEVARVVEVLFDNNDFEVTDDGDGVAYIDLRTLSTLGLRWLSADPDDPDSGDAIIWMSDGTGTGDYGDIIIKITAGGVTKSIKLVDFSEA